MTDPRRYQSGKYARAARIAIGHYRSMLAQCADFLVEKNAGLDAHSIQEWREFYEREARTLQSVSYVHQCLSDATCNLKRTFKICVIDVDGKSPNAIESSVNAWLEMNPDVEAVAFTVLATEPSQVILLTKEVLDVNSFAVNPGIDLPGEMPMQIIGTDAEFEEAVRLIDGLGLEFVDLRYVAIPAEVMSLVPRDVAMQFEIVPLCVHDDTLVVVAADPLKNDLEANLAVALNRSIKIAGSCSRWVVAAISKHYG